MDAVFEYNGQDDQSVGDALRITPYLGVLMVMDWTAMLGDAWQLSSIGDGESGVDARTQCCWAI